MTAWEETTYAHARTCVTAAAALLLFTTAGTAHTDFFEQHLDPLKRAPLDLRYRVSI
ncbi:hypothetical protein ACFYTG_48545 [Streptomyces mirabilis]|uniref:hypothetical protein n=1 Tax=Streptomyces mirabilis TaxID=68239 RepID=UPI0036CC520A